jgi:flagella basal body P-ring formation protein FlgA
VRVLLVTAAFLGLLAQGVRANERACRAAEEYLVKRFGFDPDELSVTMRENRSFDGLLGSDELHVYSTSSTPPRSTYALRFEIIRDGTVIKDISAPVSIYIYSEVLVPTSRIKRGDALNEADFELREVDIARNYRDVVPATTDISGMRASRTIPAGKPLESDMLEPIPLVNRGDDVVIKCDLGSMIIMTEGTAKEDGCEGDKIEVMNTESRKRIIAEVESSGVVVVSK